MLYHFKIQKESNGYWAECLELKGCQTEADTLSELQSNNRKILKFNFHCPLKKLPKAKA